MRLDADMKKLGLWKGLCFHMNAFQIHGRSITADNIGGLMPVSNLEATPATRLDEMWFEQHLFSDKLAVKIGQLAADMEFILSESILLTRTVPTQTRRNATATGLISVSTALRF